MIVLESDATFPKKYDVEKFEKKILSRIKATWFLIFLLSPYITKHISIRNKINLEKFTVSNFEELLNLVA